MKKTTWLVLGLTALLALPLAGCAGNRTGSDLGQETASPAPVETAKPSTMPDLSTGDDDLAGADGVVGGGGGDNNASGTQGDTGISDVTGGTGAGNTGNDNAAGSTRSALERAGEGIRDTLDDMGSAARRMGQDAKDAIEG